MQVWHRSDLFDSFAPLRESKTFLNPGFHGLDSNPATRFQSLSVEPELWIGIVSAITDSLSCIPPCKV